ncbi:hypothetical protein N7449_008515 [Penicillium cf. viridicatum]|uniref:Uncharacterized protein n=1 Tax=Penicillium cf. viridicatum TaxID=2972119 RepID=A0A9W9J8C0_9EURO|nr:hypothetical protein N7449_008515 [Penicillium cf. viridicatum]
MKAEVNGTPNLTSQTLKIAEKVRYTTPRSPGPPIPCCQRRSRHKANNIGKVAESRPLASLSEGQIEVLSRLRARETLRAHRYDTIMEEVTLLIGVTTGLRDLYGASILSISQVTQGIPIILQRLERQMMCLHEEMLGLRGQGVADQWTMEWIYRDVT